MAHELELQFQPGETNVYVCLFKNDSGTIKVNIAGGDTWEVFDDANIDNYDILISERGDESGFFTGTFPVIAAGRYVAVYYQGNKAEGTTQTVLTAEVMNWDGTAEIFTNSEIVDLLKLLRADKFIDITADPWEIIYREEGTGNALMTKTMKNTAGNDIVNRNNVLGQLTQT